MGRLEVYAYYKRNGWIGFLIQRLIDIVVVTGFFLFLSYCFAVTVRAEEPAPQPFHVLDLEELSVDYFNYVDSGRDPIIYPEIHKEAINVNINANLFKYVSWDSKILTKTTSDQYREIGLNMRVGLRLTPAIDVFYEHESIHLIDEPSHIMPRFPVSDSVGLKIYFYRKTNPRGSIF